jgi:CHRD domain-containing protein
MTRRTGVVAIVAIVGAFALVLTSVGVAGHGHGKRRSNEAKLIGYEEVPAVSTAARGKIKLKIRNGSTGTIEYRLSYSGLSAPATQAHIHFAQKGVNGGIVLWLCDSATNNSPVADTPACPPGNTADKVTVTGTLDAADVQAILVGGLPAQGIAAGELAEVLAALKAGVTYANVHSGTFPGGEIRAQLDRGGRGHDD